MVEQILPNIYRIEIPLPKNPLKVLNSYFIKDQERSLLIDTGFNLEACRTAMDQALEELGASMDETDLFITHVHSDHAGLVQHLSRPDNTVWMGGDDAEMFQANHRDNLFMKSSAKHLLRSGLLADGVPNLPGEEAVVKYAAKEDVPITVVSEGDCFDRGNYHFRAIATPGHTVGHMCLYEEEQKILIAGDHILAKITPNIGLWDLEHDLLGLYLPSLDKISKLEVDLVLPAHRHVITDMRGRIEEIKQHHARRLKDVLKALGNEKKTAAQVARLMKWDLSYKNWDEFPINQKLHAAAEAMAHLYHLKVLGQLNMTEEDGVCYFYLAP